MPLDVGEAWVPPIFAQPDSSFAATYVMLAQERFDEVDGATLETTVGALLPGAFDRDHMDRA